MFGYFVFTALRANSEIHIDLTLFANGLTLIALVESLSGHLHPLGLSRNPLIYCL